MADKIRGITIEIGIKTSKFNDSRYTKAVEGCQ